ncbi:MAG: hypothetical protein D3925_17350 [Candidatus Electrothrix sp. AR5]|nr:hypothetical protein [Candidatus Electrothrix sp. AR5]
MKKNMKKLFLTAIIALLMPFITTLYAAGPPNQADLEKMALEFEKKAEEDAKNELKRLVQNEALKKDLAAARGSQGDNQTLSPANKKKEMTKPSK